MACWLGVRLGWLVWLFGAMLGYVAYAVGANLTRRFTDDWATPIVVGTLASLAAIVVTWLVKRRMPKGPDP